MANYYKKKRRRLKPGAVILLIMLLAAAAVLLTFIITSSIRSKTEPGSSRASSVVSVSSQTVTSTAASSSVSIDPLLMIWNKDYPVPDSYKPDLVTIPTKYFIQNLPSYQFDARGASYLTGMLDAAKAAGINIGLVCSYRSKETQTEIFNGDVDGYIKQGMTSSAAASKTALTVAIPGYSEHQTGLAVDLSYNGKSYLTDNPSYDTTPAFTWLSAHAADYGFILRYPKDKVDITKYEYEPWHYRFVGVDNAKAIKASGLCLEEYVASLKSAGSKSGSSAKTSSK